MTIEIVSYWLGLYFLSAYDCFHRTKSLKTYRNITATIAVCSSFNLTTSWRRSQLLNKTRDH